MITDREFRKYNEAGAIYNKIYFYIISNNYATDIQLCTYKAIRMIRQRLDNKPARNNIAIIDLDETFLFNDYYLLHTLEAYGYNKHIQSFYRNKLDKRYGPVIPFMIIVYEYLVSKGVDVFFLTARDIKFKEDTENNLEMFNIRNYQISFKEGEISSKEYKQKEIKKIEDRGYNIVLCLNDQKEFIHDSLVAMPQLYLSAS